MNHPENFTDIENGKSTHFPCILIILMQNKAALVTELLNVWLIFEANNAKEALMNFIALEVICKIDDIYY